MFKEKWKKISLVAGLSLTLVAAGCGQDDSGSTENSGDAGSNVSEEVEYTITGIEPGAGLTQATDKALKEYENLEGWEHETASTAAMLTSLGEAIANEEPIIVAGWSPHFKFKKYDLKYLEDPKGVYGKEEYIATIARKGLKEDMPEAYTILDRFKWETGDMETVMLDAQKMDFEKAAQQWVDENQDKVSKWTKGVDKVDGKSIELVSTPWDSERSSAHVVKKVLEQQGYDVAITAVSPPVMFQAIASGDGDASVAPWMPMTHAAYYEEHEGDFVDLGKNLEGAKSGLVVPAYMEIDSIKDLKPKE
ncbi:glycine betaine ABC transporter substrate-binding protein [Thalassobacillus devorans]|uniref:glycine betaine ABC transporter substrate-binding protein n=1 Tax=Thalassobacillus devorans TaxID=279813 RepID=UPI00048C62BC|nr:glycine betaine ABC transporter substrate-binding protein [Thalassobacillus devorans]